MARAINLEEPLSQEDKRYLLERDRNLDVAYAKQRGTWGEEHPIEKRARIRDEMDGEPATDLTRPSEYSPEEEASAEPEDTDTNYERWNKNDLVAEINRRNSEMGPDETPLSAEGTRVELARRLREDDEVLT